MSTEIKVGDRRIFRSTTAREIEIVERLTEDPFAGEFRYRYVDTDGGWGILPAENLEMSSRPAPTAPPTAAPQDHGPLAAVLSDRTLDKVLSRPTRVFGFNVVTISPQGIPGGPRLDGVVSRQRAQDELDELEPFMVDGWKTVLVELREVTS